MPAQGLSLYRCSNTSPNFKFTTLIDVKCTVQTHTAEFANIAQRGKRLEYFTIGWNSLEGLGALAAGIIAGSISLVGFGVDSFIEVTSAAALLWRLSVIADEESREQNERLTLKIVGMCFLALSVYVASISISNLLQRHAAGHSIAGIVVACAALVAMPLLSRAKKQIGERLGSAAMVADARQADFCTYLSAILLVGLVLNATVGWWWADPIAALVMTPIIAKEGIDAWQGKACCETKCNKPI